MSGITTSTSYAYLILHGVNAYIQKILKQYLIILNYIISKYISTIDYFNLFLPGELGPVGEVVGHVYRSHQLGVVVIEVVRAGEAELSSLHVGTPG